VILDKTGTVTAGKPQVTDLVLIAEIELESFLQIAASLEAPSEHPLSLAILEYATENRIEINLQLIFSIIWAKALKLKSIIGAILPAIKNTWLKMVFDLAPTLEIFNQLSVAGKTTLYFADQDKLLGMIAVADTVKSNSKQAIELLHQAGVKVYLLTGDNQRTAEAIGKSSV